MSMIHSFKTEGTFFLSMCEACRIARDSYKKALDDLHNAPESERRKKGYGERAVLAEKTLNWSIGEYDKMYSFLSGIERMADGCEVEVIMRPVKSEESKDE